MPTNEAQTIWHYFMKKRGRAARANVHRFLWRTLLGWSIVSGICIASFFGDDLSAAETDLLWVIIPVHFVLELIIVAAMFVTGVKLWKNSYQIPLAILVLVFAVVFLGQGAFVDVALMSSIEGGNQPEELSTSISFSILFVATWMSIIRIILTDRKHLSIVYFAAGVAFIGATGVRLYAGRYTSFGYPDLVPYLVMIPCVALNLCIARVEIRNEWYEFITRKRLQAECIRSEELLTLAMPKEIAHAQMMGMSTPRSHDCASVAFLYLSGYSTLVAGTEYELPKLMKFMDDYFSSLDEIVLAHPGVYKIENVGNCYVVASGVIRSSANHAANLIEFCHDVMNDHRFRSSSHNEVVNESDICHGVEPLGIKIGVHCGPLSSGVIGTCRTFYRLFGDTVNTASRIAAYVSPGELGMSSEFYGSLSSDEVHRQSDCYQGLEPESVHLKGKGAFEIYRIVYDGNGTRRNCMCSGVFNPDGSPKLNESSEVTDVRLVAQVSPKGATFNLQYSTRALGWESYSQDDPTEETHSTIRKAQDRVASVSKFLDYKLNDALQEYSKLDASLLPTAESYHVGKLERLSLARVIVPRNRSKKTDTCVHHERRSPSDQISDAGRSNQEIDEGGSEWFRRQFSSLSSKSSSSSNMMGTAVVDMAFIGEPETYSVKRCGFCRRKVLKEYPTLFARFRDEAVEAEYKSQRHSLTFDLLCSSFGHLLLVMFYLTGVYSANISGSTANLLILYTPLAFGFCMLQAMSKKFSHLSSSRRIWQGNPTIPRNTKSPHVANLPSMSTLDDSYFSKARHCLQENFSVWLSAFCSLVLSAFILADSMWLSKAPQSDRVCLDSFVLPVLLLPTLHIFRMLSKPLAMVELYGFTLFFALHAISGRLASCSLSTQVVGILLLSATTYNSMLDSAHSELKTRRAYTLYSASTQAKQQAETVTGLLFPPIVNEKLKRNEPVSFEIFEDVIILWSDIVGFTALASSKQSRSVMELLDELYSSFDKNVGKLNLWKVDTIGDAYVVIGGLNTGRTEFGKTAEKVFDLSQAMISSVAAFNEKNSSDLGVRIGIHSGRVGAGIVGKLRPRFHVFGKTVLDAEHLESTSQRNEVHISLATANRYRGIQFGFAASHKGTCWLRPPGI
eukprot:gb/GECG01014203.1/.p1 GENE.gb/GECG01014203.1/~~gb/GECG01014203.1/.p1  ORF type:complete len:1130 (+),score=78.99 gb/GECG01014203.1/:1-3390(+)